MTALPGAENDLIAVDSLLTNRQSLESQLGLPDASTLTDEQIVAEAWTRWGLDMVHHLCGAFAIVIARPRTDELILIRDQGGQRPLHFVALQHLTAFASVPRAFLALGDVALNISFERLAQIVGGVRYTGWECPLTPVQAVRPAEIVRIQGGKVERGHYWPRSVEEFTESNDWLQEEYHARLEAVVDELVGPESSVIATHLSSGWDSGAVTAMASRRADRRPVVAFTSAPGSPDEHEVVRNRITDESAVAAAVAAHLGVEHHIVHTRPAILKGLASISAQIGDPYFNQVNIGWWIDINQAAKNRGADRVLTAQSGNESLNSGGAWALSHHARPGGLRTLFSQIMAARKRSSLRWRGLLFSAFGRYIPRRFQDLLFPPADRRLSAIINPAYRKAVRARRSIERRRFRGSLLNQRIESLRENDPALIGRALLSMNGADEFDVMADVRLLEFGLRLPARALYHDGVDRPVARAALAKILPHQILESRSRGLQGADWPSRMNAAEASAAFDELFRHPGVCRLLNAGGIRKILSEWREDERYPMRHPLLLRLHLLRAAAAAYWLVDMEDRIRGRGCRDPLGEAVK